LRRHLPSLPKYKLGEEIAHSVSHGLGALLSVGGSAVAITFAYLHGESMHVIACSVFGASLFLLYMSSTLYHALTAPAAKRVFQVLDHTGIYVLIAGTYTPFTLVTLGDALGWTMFGVIWGLAVVGIVTRATMPHLARWISLPLYLGMGWGVVFVAGPVISALETGALWLLALGGLAYTVGVPFYAIRRIPYHHAIWHALVLVGSALHYFAVLFYVVPGMR
jgi:hemolysin III